MAEFLSKRVRKKDPLRLSTTRYEFLSLDEAEPDLGNPLVGPSSIGAKPFPAESSAYILASFATTATDRGDRFWVPPSSLTGLGLGLIPGAFTILNQGSLVGAATSFTTLNFVGPSVSVDFVSPLASEQTGVATVRFVSLGFGNDREFQYKGSTGTLAGATGFVFNPIGNNIGIGTTLPTSKFEVNGNVKISGISTLNILDVTQIESKNIINSGILTTNSVSIGGTQVLSSGRQLQNIVSLDSITTETIEIAIASAPNNFDDLSVSGIGTFGGILIAENGLQVSAGASIDSLNVSGITTVNTLIANNSNVSGVSTVGVLSATNLFVSGVSTLGVLSVTNANIIETLQVGFTTAESLYVSTAATITSINSNDITTTSLVSNNIQADTVNVSISATVTKLNSSDITSSVLSVGSTAIIGSRIGIGTAPDYELDVNGDIQTSGFFYVSNGRGISGQVLLSQGTAPPVWGAPDNVTVGSAQSIAIENQINDSDYYYVTLSKEFEDVGFINVDTDGLVYQPSTNNLGIGSTLPQFNLDVGGNINFTGTLFQSGELYIASRWGANSTETTLYKLGNVGIGTTVVPTNFYVKGTSAFDGIVDFDDEVNFNDYANLQAGATEKVISNFTANIPSTGGKVTIDISQSTVVVGVLTESISTWEFNGVSADSSKAATVTLIIDSDSLFEYGNTYTIPSLGLSGNVRWSGGIAPVPTNNEDIISFTVISDQSGNFRVYGTSSLNFS
jgi:hypothetical protein